MTDTGARLLRRVVAEPDDDTPRLILADWLEENGQEDRAEFVRVQCELARLSMSDDGGPPYVMGCGREAIQARELELMRPGRRWWSDYGPGDRITVLAWRRGFVDSLACTLADWLDHGREIILYQPVTKCRITDREPMVRVAPGNVFWLLSAGNEALPDRHVLPARLRGLADDHWVTCAGADAALEFLSDVCVAWARDAAGLPPRQEDRP